MISMILADDETIIIRGLKKLIDWKSLGINIVGEYEDGKSAFEGILIHKPELILLDINMPQKSGLDILKEIKELGLECKVIFISGFQDFEYVQTALNYGAEGYLLKPILKEELVNVIEKAILSFRRENLKDTEKQKTEQNKILTSDTAYQRLLETEDCTYRAVLVGAFANKSVSHEEKRLLRFAVINFLENHLKECNAGVVFTREEKIVMILKEYTKSENEIEKQLFGLREYIGKEMHCCIGFIVGDKANTIRDIPKSYEKCLLSEGYFYFVREVKIPIFWWNQPIQKKVINVEIDKLRKEFYEAFLMQDEENYKKQLKTLEEAICLIADGQKENAFVHYVMTIRAVEEKFHTMSLIEKGLDLTNILAQVRETECYKQMAELFSEVLSQYYRLIQESIRVNDRQDINKAMDYIKAHFQENLTLEVLAKVMYMNSYYFSAFFKKNAGQNFKDYLNEVRLEKAVTLLVSTNKTTTNIASDVGFRDGRSFSELFQRVYKETPTNYRKRLK